MCEVQKETQRKIIVHIEHVVECILQAGRDDHLVVSLHSLSLRSYACVANVMNVIHLLLQENKHMRKRDLYYFDVQLFGHQRRSDKALDYISRMMKVPRNHLNVMAAERGTVLGPLVYFQQSGTCVDCLQHAGGKPIPACTDDIKKMTTNARFILLVEKDATFARLADERFPEKYGPCIVITAKGIPDIGTRTFTKRLHDEFQLPVYALVDWNPYGVEILLIYTTGSKNMQHDAVNLAIPDIKWLGIHHTDLHKVSASCLQPLTKHDVSKAKQLLVRPSVLSRPKWRQELEKMLEVGKKAEIQALAEVSLSYFTTNYLPNKLEMDLTDF